MTDDTRPLPVEGTWVRRRGEDGRIGRVLQLWDGDGEPGIRVQWSPSEATTEPLRGLVSGIQPDFWVQDVPWSIARRTLGVGRVRAVRRLANVDQALVQLEADGRLVWLPSFALRRLMGPDLAFLRAAAPFPDAGERFALCLIGHALRLWNEATGALDRLFKGHTVTQVPVDPSPAMRELDRRLRAYLRRGYNAGDQIGGAGGRAIGFVMTTYRKLASSSIAAIERALRRRLERLGTPAAPRGPGLQGWGDEDDADDLADRDLGEPAGQFFADEAAMLRSVLDQCEVAAAADAKIAAFRTIYDQVVRQGGRKLLVFSEYRATQDRLVEEVRLLSGGEAAQINGGQKLADKLDAIRRFDDDVAVLVSTEAGGEGLNLQRQCHVVLNYDLPWNPARLVQRIGRIYRYGQTRHVQVLNLLSRDTIDADILSTALTRVDALTREMASVSGEFDGRYYAEVLGELLDQLDVSELLDEARSGQVTRSPERVQEAVQRARTAQQLQAEMLSGAAAFDPGALAAFGRFATGDVLRYVARMAPFGDYEAIVAEGGRERVQLRLPDRLRGRFAEFGGRTVIEATTSRATAAASPSLTLIDFGGSFLPHLVALSSAPEFGGGYAAVTLPGRGGQLAATLIRWQSDQGDPLGEELHVLCRQPDGRVAPDDAAVGELLAAPVGTGVALRFNDQAERRSAFDACRAAAEERAAAQVTRQRIPNDLVLLAIADVVGG